MALEKTEALVLRSIKFGETSRIVTFFSRDFGLIKAIAKGARAARPRFGAALDPFARLDLVFYRKPQRDLHLVSQADLIDGFLPLSDSVQRYAFASAVVEFLGQVIGGEEAAPALYGEAVEAMILLGVAPPEVLPYLLRAFQLRVMGLLGHGLELSRCVVCGRDREEPRAVDTMAGGVVCAGCAPEGGGAIALSAPALRALRAYTANPLRAAVGQRLAPPVRAEVGRLVEAFLSMQLESYRGLKSLRLAAELRRR